MYKVVVENEGQDRNPGLWKRFYNHLLTVSSNVLLFWVWLEVIWSWTMKNEIQPRKWEFKILT